MSIIKSVQTWLTTFDGMALKPINEVLTDSTENIGDTALAPAGNFKVITDCAGNKTHQNSYVFYAKESGINEVDREENYDFLEALTDWIEEQDEDENYPLLGSGITVDNVSVSNSMLFSVDEDGTALYQVQIQIIYTKWSY